MMTGIPTRRGLLLGLGAVIAAPAIVRATSLMPVRAVLTPAWGISLFAAAHPETQFIVHGFDEFGKDVIEIIWLDADKINAHGGPLRITNRMRISD